MKPTGPRNEAVLVAVTWRDANGTATRLYSKEHHAYTEMVTVGWLMVRDKAGVSICCERFVEDGAYVYRGHTFIPAGIVTKVRRLERVA